MSKELDSRSKTALDETRLLLMGAMLLDLNPKRFSRELLDAFCAGGSRGLL
jgi:hypothetical protein